VAGGGELTFGYEVAQDVWSNEAPLPVPWVAGLVPWAGMGC
jgi:hypothetical protein